MGRILAIDYGAQRTGLAMTDELRLSINPLPTASSDNLLERINELMETFFIDSIVLGVSYHPDGVLTRNAQEAVALGEKIKKKWPVVRIHLVDEAFSSLEARQTMRQMGIRKKHRSKKEMVDQMSAVILLRDFLNQSEL